MIATTRLFNSDTARLLRKSPLIRVGGNVAIGGGQRVESPPAATGSVQVASWG